MHQSLRSTDCLDVTVNGRALSIRGVRPETPLLDWLRNNGLTGSKQGCAEGDCGACTVALADRDAEGRPAWRAINSCIAPIASFAGREILTVDGLARGEKLHPAQEGMVRNLGSQCGYCTPGFVMSLFEGCHRADMANPTKIADQLCGNLCRCTGYRPIRDAAMELYAEGRPDDGLEPEWNGLDESRYESGNGSFYRPTMMTELFALREAHPEAVLVAGATELGVDVTKKFRHFETLISLEGIEELRACEKSEEGWSLGAAATLTQIEEFLDGEIPIFSHMLSVFASRQIRNRATLGGNLATASPIGDSAPVLLALGANVLLAGPGGERTVPLDEFFVGYRKTRLQPDEVLKSIRIPAASPGRRAQFYKTSKRREMDISIVAAAFCVDCDEDGVVTSARFGFGGVAAMPSLAGEAAAALIGKRIDDPAAADAVAGKIDFEPISDARGTAEYRRGLAVSLWRKFAAGDTSAAQDDKLSFEGGHCWECGDASRAGSHESAVGHVTGRAQYVEDQALRRGGMLTMWPVCAPHAHARLLSLDASAAEAMPGVACVLTAADVPGINDVGCSRPDESLFASEEVLFHGHMIAVVVADSVEHARAASAKVKAEFEPLPAILTIADAIANDSFHTDPNFIRRGDAAGALKAAPHQLHGTFELGGQEHFYLESHAAWAEALPDGGVFVSSSTQHPTEIQIIVARVLGLPRNQVVVEAPRMGGGFGGKETQGNTWAALAALASLKTERAVRVQLDRDLDMQLSGKRHPFLAKFHVGYDNEGHLLGAKVDLISNGGWSLDLSMPITDRALFHLDNGYYIPAVEFSGRAAKTHLVSNTAFRGFGGPQGMLVIEEIMDRIARSLDLPPEVVRARNLYRGSGESNRTHYGQDIGDNRLQDLWAGALEDSEFGKRRAEIAGWNAEHPMVKRGLAITPVKFGISFTFTPYNQAGALLLAYADGSVQINHAGTEMGQGLHTKMLGVVMRELGLPANHIRQMFTRTDKIPNTSATAASSGADLNGAAVADACRVFRERMRPVAAKMLDAPEDAEMHLGDGRVWFDPAKTATFAEVCGRMHMERVSLSASGFYRTPSIHWDRASGKGRPFYYFACGVAVSEVEVDGWSGMHRVRRVDIVHDVGESLNPGIDRGQIEGGFVQGMGWLTREELLWSDAGQLLTHSASTYQIPAFSDAPADFRVRMLPKAAQEGTIHGSKAVGEPPLMLAISVREAIRDAVAAFGAAGGIVELASPATCETIFHAVRRRLNE